MEVPTVRDSRSCRCPKKTTSTNLTVRSIGHHHYYNIKNGNKQQDEPGGKRAEPTTNLKQKWREQPENFKIKLKQDKIFMSENELPQQTKTCMVQ